MDKIKVIIADDSDFVREGMRIILGVDEEFEVLGCASDGKEAIEIARNTNQMYFLWIYKCQLWTGVEATKQIASENLGKVLVLTTFDDDELVQKAIQNGAQRLPC